MVVLLLLEKNDAGRGTSSRNSEVLHVGLYYPKDFLKSILCRRELERLYRLAAGGAVECRPLGKRIVAADSTELIPWKPTTGPHGRPAAVTWSASRTMWTPSGSGWRSWPRGRGALRFAQRSSPMVGLLTWVEVGAGGATLWGGCK